METPAAEPSATCQFLLLPAGTDAGFRGCVWQLADSFRRDSAAGLPLRLRLTAMCLYLLQRAPSPVSRSHRDDNPYGNSSDESSNLPRGCRSLVLRAYS